jgi:hypothetical protein
MASVCTLRSCLCRFTRRRVTTLPRWRARVLDWPRLYGLVLPGGSHVWALYTRRPASVKKKRKACRSSEAGSRGREPCGTTCRLWAHLFFSEYMQNCNLGVLVGRVLSTLVLVMLKKPLVDHVDLLLKTFSFPFLLYFEHLFCYPLIMESGSSLEVY